MMIISINAVVKQYILHSMHVFEICSNVYLCIWFVFMVVIRLCNMLHFQNYLVLVPNLVKIEELHSTGPNGPHPDPDKIFVLEHTDLTKDATHMHILSFLQNSQYFKILIIAYKPKF